MKLSLKQLLCGWDGSTLTQFPKNVKLRYFKFRLKMEVRYKRAYHTLCYFHKEKLSNGPNTIVKL